ncbi:transmembrane signal receptor [Lithospermum erythrorhizon]|uniref:Transmembrane signal receptor n=1 Tax=Lithospermum erythrorhizon TaxID=34254 RepID=A0AAV3Q028_LITER
MEVKTSFLNGDLTKEVYMEQPEGFVLPGNEQKVSRLVKSICDLKQAPKQWQKKFDDAILANGFKHIGADKCIYSKSCNEYIVILCLYVDDMLIFSNSMEGIVGTKKYLSSVFDMKDLGEVDTILEIKVKIDEKGFTLSQTHYIDKMIDKFKHLDIKEALTPYDHSNKLEENKGRVVAQLKHASAIGSLMYVTHCIRIDIAFDVCKLSRFTSKPSMEHWESIKRVLGYIKDTRNMIFNIMFFQLIQNVDNKVTLGGGAISWALKNKHDSTLNNGIQVDIHNSNRHGS